ncbi:hypothetical protein CEP53_002096 [Fusarium sp. AF-6]|nr:hypothetical protein CEP53_002096 [Fusarium sp. AF-6]
MGVRDRGGSLGAHMLVEVDARGSWAFVVSFEFWNHKSDVRILLAIPLLRM